jgi:phage tail-like protein
MSVVGAISNIGEVSIQTDPLLGYNFLVSLLDTSSGMALVSSIALSAIEDIALGGFSECSGLDMSLDIHEYEEGGQNGYVHKFPTRVKWANITLKKGLGASTALWDWHFGFVNGKGKRRDGIISLQDDLHQPTHIWYFRRGLPVRYTGPTMNAGQSSIAIEAVEIAHEGLYQVPHVGYGAASVRSTANIVSTIPGL